MDALERAELPDELSDDAVALEVFDAHVKSFGFLVWSRREDNGPDQPGHDKVTTTQKC
jgi:hypothetical protein